MGQIRYQDKYGELFLQKCEKIVAKNDKIESYVKCPPNNIF